MPSPHLCCGCGDPRSCPLPSGHVGTAGHLPPSQPRGDSLTEPLAASLPPQPGSWPPVASDPDTLCSPRPSLGPAWTSPDGHGGGPSLGPAWTFPDGHGGGRHSWSRLQHAGAQQQPRGRRRAPQHCSRAWPGRTPISFTLCCSVTSTRLAARTSWVCTCPFGCCCGAALRKLQSPLLEKQILPHAASPKGHASLYLTVGVVS